MTLLQNLLHLTDFRNPFLRNAVPCISTAFAIQAAFAVPSIVARSERFYDFSGALTNLAVTALSLYLPALRAGAGLPSLLDPFTDPASASLNWRQVVLSTAVAVWAARRAWAP